MEKQVERKAVTIRLASSAVEEVEKIAKDLGITVNEVFRRALGTEIFFQEAKERGEKILLESRNKEVREVVLR